nr:pepsin/retropepsin-like aspartic protease family protein [Pseudoxanthomonas sp.]
MHSHAGIAPVVLLLLATQFVGQSAIAKPVEIPFEEGKDHRIFVQGTINDSRPLRLLFDTGANEMAVNRALKDEASLVIDDTAENTGSDGVSALDYSSGNLVRAGGMEARMGAVLVEYRNRPFDAVLGHRFFQDRIVEINYDRSRLVVHERMPDLAGYAKAKVKMVDDTPVVRLSLVDGTSTVRPWLFFDTGSNGSIDLSYAFASRHKLKEKFTQVVGTSQYSGSAGKKIRAVDVRIQSAGVAGVDLKQPKISLTIDEDASQGDGIVGSDFIHHFNVIMDLKGGYLYLKPNQRVSGSVAAGQ